MTHIAGHNEGQEAFDTSSQGFTVEFPDSKYLGIPDDYRGPLSSRPQTGDARFLKGGLGGFRKDIGPGEPYTKKDALEIMNWSPDRIQGFQRMLLELGNPFGFGPRTKFLPGIVDGPTRSSYERILSYANQRGLTANEALQEIASGALEAGRLGIGGGGGSGRKFTPPPFQPMAEEKVKQLLQTVYQSAVGRDPKPNELAAHVSEYRKLEKEHHSKVVGAERAAFGGKDPGTIEDLADPATATKPKVEATAEADDFRASQIGTMMKSMLMGGS